MYVSPWLGACSTNGTQKMWFWEVMKENSLQSVSEVRTDVRGR